ncbi:hypothetical protein NDU88_002000 [Pleurodeles waltl]|uniref:Uncharacterized protein n=1 Tax=Pleurodeles waltl TaxID=8319 RepID=A0AAV7Q7N9_PLEWA|nr:hypothetical protein NDU88_002000 [Pleurodeles waltl]
MEKANLRARLLPQKGAYGRGGERGRATEKGREGGSRAIKRFWEPSPDRGQEHTNRYSRRGAPLPWTHAARSQLPFCARDAPFLPLAGRDGSSWVSFRETTGTGPSRDLGVPMFFHTGVRTLVAAEILSGKPSDAKDQLLRQLHALRGILLPGGQRLRL